MGISKFRRREAREWKTALDEEVALKGLSGTENPDTFVLLTGN